MLLSAFHIIHMHIVANAQHCYCQVYCYRLCSEVEIKWHFCAQDKKHNMLEGIDLVILFLNIFITYV
jgi:hypothetical protein